MLTPGLTVMVTCYFMGVALRVMLWSTVSLILGFVISFEIHELFFTDYAKRVVKLPELSYVLQQANTLRDVAQGNPPPPCFIAMIERYYGPFYSDYVRGWRNAS